MYPPARDGLRMAAKKKAAGARREPTFDDDDGPELRVTASDRASSADNAPSSKPRKRRTRKKRPARGIGARIGRIAYWGLVAGLWFGIACVGVIAWTGAHLPPIQSLEIPKRPPSIQIVDMQGRALARRGDLAGAPLPLQGNAALRAEGIHRHRGPALLSTLRRRSVRHRARLGRQRAASRRRAGRLDHHAAARQESVPDAGAHAHAQAAGGDACALARAQVLQDADSRAVSQPRLFRLGRLWHRTASQRYFGKSAQQHHAGGSGDARRPGANRRRGLRRHAISTPPRSARKSCSPPWATCISSTAAPSAWRWRSRRGSSRTSATAR